MGCGVSSGLGCPDVTGGVATDFRSDFTTKSTTNYRTRKKTKKNSQKTRNESRNDRVLHSRSDRSKDRTEDRNKRSSAENSENSSDYSTNDTSNDTRKEISLDSRDYRMQYISNNRIDAEPENITITVIEAQQQLLPGFPPAAREFAETYLREQGVTVITGQRITAVRNASLVLASDKELSHSMLIWTGGIKPSPLIDGLSLPKDPAGWLIVTDQLRSPADERFYAVGDVVTIQGPDGALPLPRLAHHARDQAEVAGLNIASFLNGKNMIRYKPRFKPQLISIGRDMGIYTQGATFKSGAWVVDLKKAVERKHLMSYLTRPLIAGISRKVPGIDAHLVHPHAQACHYRILVQLVT